MKRSVSRGMPALPIIFVLAVGSSAAQSSGTLAEEPLRCQRQLGKEGLKFKKAKLKAWQKCLDALLRGRSCDTAKRDEAIAQVEEKFIAKVSKSCPGQLLFEFAPDGVGFTQGCDLEPGSVDPAEAECRALEVTDPASLGHCLVCWKQAELHGLLRALYPCLGSEVPAGSGLECGTPPVCPDPTDKAAVRCTRSIAKAGIDFLLAKEKALERCLDAVREGKIAGPCPDAAAQEKIAKAEEKKTARIEKCAEPPPWWDVCPKDTLPPCDQAVASLSDIAACVEGAAETIVDQVVCQQYPGAAASGISCARNFEVVGYHDLGGGGFNADVYSFGDFAYVGVWGRGAAHCPATGIKVVDISDPARPVLAGVLQNPAGTTAEDVVVKHVSTPSFTGDLLMTGIQTCGLGPSAFRGLLFFDVTDPYAPRELGRWDAAQPTLTIGCHEVDLAVRSDGRVLAACANNLAELFNGTDEVAIVDATDPSAPQKVGGFALGEDLGIDPAMGVGCLQLGFAHSVRFFDDGRDLYVSYWDAGTILLDVDDPASPAFVGRTVITPRDEDGDNHSMSLARGGQVLLINPEDFSPLGDCEPGDWNGWGELFLYDNTDPANTALLGTFGTPNTATQRTDGWYTVHNTEVVGDDQVFASWYSDGVRWIDISDPAQPLEKGHFIPPPAPDPQGSLPPYPLVWGVWPHPNGLILASDINRGLWILRPTGFTP